MRRSFAVAAGVGVGFVLGLAFHGTALKVGAVSPPRATLNGDTNGDGTRDLSDAVYLLQFLFSGGGEIAEIDCPDTPREGIVFASNQEDCFGEAGVVACSAPKARGQDAFYHLGICPLENRFVDNGDGTISDTCTGLMWTSTVVDTDGDGEILEKDRRTWLEACQHAHDMTYLGYDDWRVPNIQELNSIVHFGKPGMQRPYMGFYEPFFTQYTIVHQGTWVSTSLGIGGGAFSVATPADGTACNCSFFQYRNANELVKFVAVRGPVSQ